MQGMLNLNEVMIMEHKGQEIPEKAKSINDFYCLECGVRLDISAVKRGFYFCPVCWGNRKRREWGGAYDGIT